MNEKKLQAVFEKKRDAAARKLFDAKYPATCRTPKGDEWTFEQSHSLQLCRESMDFAFKELLPIIKELSEALEKYKKIPATDDNFPMLSFGEVDLTDPKQAEIVQMAIDSQMTTAEQALTKLEGYGDE